VVDIAFWTADTPEHSLFWMPESEVRSMVDEPLLPERNTIDILNDRVFNMKISLGNMEFSLVSTKGEAKI
jgi:hypothetical protein